LGIGPPSSLKTVIVELFRKWKNSYYTDSFTARTFVSHYSGIKEEQLKKIDIFAGGVLPVNMKKDE
jgi:hypothetical protein